MTAWTQAVSSMNAPYPNSWPFLNPPGTVGSFQVGNTTVDVNLLDASGATISSTAAVVWLEDGGNYFQGILNGTPLARKLEFVFYPPVYGFMTQFWDDCYQCAQSLTMEVTRADDTTFSAGPYDSHPGGYSHAPECAFGVRSPVGISRLVATVNTYAGEPGANCLPDACFELISLQLDAPVAAPVITAHPQSVTTCTAGSTVTFNAAATGSYLGYQWRKDGTAIPGATSPTLQFQAQSSQVGTYDVVVCNPTGSVTSNPATFDLSTGASITAGPGDATRCVGSSVTFTISVAGGGPYSIQWATPRSGGVYGGPNATSLTLNDLTLADAGSIAVRVNNACTGTAEAFGTLSINTPPVITVGPANAAACAGDSATFSISVSGGGPYSIQWATPRSGGVFGPPNATAIMLDDLGPADAGTIAVRVNNACTGTAEASATLTIMAPPVIVSGPGDAVRCAGDSVTFSVSVAGTGPFIYEWAAPRFFGVFGPPNAPSLTLTMLTALDVGPIRVRVTGPCGGPVEASGTLAVNVSPTVTSGPGIETRCVGDSVTFSISVAGGGPYTIQWATPRSGGVYGPPNATSITLDALAVADAGQIAVRVNNACIGTAEAFGSLVVKTPPVITSGPVGAVRCVGDSVTFSIAVSGSGPFTIAWATPRSGGVFGPPDATSITLNALTLADAGAIAVRVNNSWCTGTATAGCDLAVDQVPVITSGPGNQTRCVGDSVTFSITATGGGPYTVQWATPRSGGVYGPPNSMSLTLDDLTLADAGAIAVRVNNACIGTAEAFGTLAVKTPPAITAGPADATRCVGQDVTFTIVVAGSGPFTIEWATPRSGGQFGPPNAASITLNDLTLADAGGISVRVNNSWCTGTAMASCNLAVVEAPLITSGPGDGTRCLGEDATFAIQIEGSGPYTIDWWTPRSGAWVNTNSNSLTLTNVAATDAGPILVRVKNEWCPGTATASGSLTVLTPPVITAQPASQLGCVQGSVTFSVAATGSEPISYQWAHDAVPIPGATSSSYGITSVTLTDSGTYHVVVTNVCGTVTSDIATLSVGDRPQITAPPQDQFSCAGGSVAFTVTATSALPVTYGWFHDGAPIPGATGPTLSITAVAPTSAGTYAVTVTNACGAVSAAAHLSVGAPVIVDPPDAGAICPGGTTTMTVAAMGGGTIAYQWFKDGAPIVGAVSPSLTLTPARSVDTGLYHVTATNACGSTASAQVPITVTVAADRAWAPVGSAPNDAVYALETFDDGSGPALYAGGAFTSLGGIAVAHLAKWANGTWQPVGGGVNGNVHALAVLDLGNGPELHAAGEFTTAGGVSARRVAAWNGTAWHGFSTGIDNGIVRALTAFDAGSGLRLFVGGTFTMSGSNAGLARWNGSAWTTVGGGVNGTVHALEVFDAGSGPWMYVGGDFNAGGNVPDARLTRWGSGGFAALGAPTPNGAVRTMAAIQDAAGAALYVGGDFTGGLGIGAARRVARWSGTTWSVLGAGLADGSVRAITPYDDGSGQGVYAAGTFTAAGTVAASRVARWQNDAWSALDAGFDNTIRALEVHVSDGCADLFAGGAFNTSGSITIPKVGRWKPAFTAAFLQPLGPGSLQVTNAFGPAGVNYFTAFSADPANAASPGTGIWYGLHISIEELVNQFLLGLPPFVGTLDANGVSVFVLPAGTLSGLSGATVWAITGTYDPVLLLPGQFTPIAAVTIQ